MVPSTSRYSKDCLHIESPIKSMHNEDLPSKPNSISRQIHADTNRYQLETPTRNKKEYSIGNYRRIRKKSKEFKKMHLTKRASTMNIAKKSSSEKTIINIQKIEQVILMWRKIKCITINSKKKF